MRENLRDMAKKKKMIRGVKNTQTDHPPYLPQEVILENILTRLPFKTLIRWGCVCKLWYNSIYHDPHFASSHFLQSQKNPRLIFNFLNVKYHRQKLLSNYFFSLTEDEKEDYGDGVDILLRSNANLLNCTYKRELVGYCNGLVCLLENMGHLPGNIEIFNPSWLELLWIFRPAFDGRIICYGFGLDSLIKEYKVVLILYTVEKEFKCLVFTLGTNSWRETTSPPPSSRQILRTARPYSKSAAMFCGGALFWRSTKEPNETLLSFDLHNETFQVIQLPADCVSPTSEQQKLVHLLESKGSLCVARLEKILGSDEDHHHHDQISGCKVHLHFLKDEVKQVWIKETFDLLSSGSPHCCFDITTSRIVGFSGWILLYWFDMESLKFYDLHMKHLKVVKPSLYDHHIFEQRKRKPSNIDYQLNSHLDNLLSLKTFLPEGAHLIDYDALQDILTRGGHPLPRGYLYICGKSRESYIFN